MSDRPHAIDRAWERYGVALSQGDLLEISRIILRGDAVLVRDVPADTGPRWLVKIHGVTIMVVASRMTAHVITVLPPGNVPREKRGTRIPGDQAKRTHRNRQVNKGWRGSGKGKRHPRPRKEEKQHDHE